MEWSDDRTDINVISVLFSLHLEIILHADIGSPFVSFLSLEFSHLEFLFFLQFLQILVFILGVMKIAFDHI